MRNSVHTFKMPSPNSIPSKGTTNLVPSEVRSIERSKKKKSTIIREMAMRQVG